MPRILASVSNKKWLEKFKRLTESGWEMISTGSTATYLESHGIPCIQVEDVTGFPEMLGGWVKTMHPKIFGGILADRHRKDQMDQIMVNDIEPIDIVVVNLYDFGNNPSIEKIDIDGTSLLRAAAKNAASVAVLVDPNDYDRVLDQIVSEGAVSELLRERLTLKVFEHTFAYDALIAKWMRIKIRNDEPFLTLTSRTIH